MIVAPVEEFGYGTMATNAGKAACYAPSHCKLSTRFGPLKSASMRQYPGGGSDGT